MDCESLWRTDEIARQHDNYSKDISPTVNLSTVRVVQVRVCVAQRKSVTKLRQEDHGFVPQPGQKKFVSGF